MSPRYVLALCVHLPNDGAFAASRQGGIEFRGWDAAQYALVGVVNAVNVTNHILSLVNRDPKKPKPKPPEPFPTPGSSAAKVEKSKPAAGSFAAMAATMMAAQRRRRERGG